MDRLRIALLLACTALVAAAPVPRRIVSVNLCADQYLMALADKRQIAAVTRFARDPQMSAGAAIAAGLPVSRGSAEDVLALDPDLVLAPIGWMPPAGEHVRTVRLGPAESYAEIVAQIRQVAAAVGHPDRGEAMVRRMDAALAALPKPAGRHKVAAYYQRRGYLTGTGTLVDEMMRRVGLVNLADRLGRPPLSRLSLEDLVAARPDYLIVESATDRVEDQGTELLHHPILAAIPRLRLTQAWTVCGGPAYVQAVRGLAAQLSSRR